LAWNANNDTHADRAESDWPNRRTDELQSYSAAWFDSLVEERRFEPSVPLPRAAGQKEPWIEFQMRSERRRQLDVLDAELF